MNDGNTTRKLSWGNILALVLISGLIVSLIAGAFVWSVEKFKISVSIITLVSFLILIALSNIFDNFSIGKLFSMSRLADENKKKAERLEKEKEDLLINMIKITSTQNQNSYNIFDPTGAVASKLFVQQASKEEIAEKSEKSETPEAEPNNSIESPVNRRISRSRVEDAVFMKYFGTAKIHNIIREAKVVAQFQGIDQISDRSLIFDGYLNDSALETFIEITRNDSVSFSFHDRLYIMLNKIKTYREFKKSNAYLLLLVAKLEIEDGRPYTHFDRVKKFFDPAIANGLLKVEFVDIPKQEMESLFEDREATI